MERLMTNIEFVQPIGVTQEASTLNFNFSNAWSIYIGNSILLSKKMQEQTFKQFIHLKNKWKDEVSFLSDSSKIESNKAYKEIISFGPIAVPWIIHELKKRNDHWFYALEKITGVNPIKATNRGKVQEMKMDWIEWAKLNNYL